MSIEENKIEELKELLVQAKSCIDHARKWIKNMHPEFKDEGIYKKISEDIKKKLETE